MDLDYYCTLGVGKLANASELKKAYHKGVLEHHPDKNNGSSKAEEMFKRINEAHAILTTWRTEYDTDVSACQFRIAPSKNSDKEPQKPQKRRPPFTFDPRKHEENKQRQDSHQQSRTDGGYEKHFRSTTPKGFAGDHHWGPPRGSPFTSGNHNFGKSKTDSADDSAGSSSDDSSYSSGATNSDEEDDKSRTSESSLPQIPSFKCEKRKCSQCGSCLHKIVGSF